jgi:hypothetical protein
MMLAYGDKVIERVALLRSAVVRSQCRTVRIARRAGN